jgi:hypothetical protein
MSRAFSIDGRRSPAKPRIEKLDRNHAVDAFDCGAEPLNIYHWK